MEKCDGCELANVEYTLVNGAEESVYCRECLEEAIADFVFAYKIIKFKWDGKRLIIV